MKQSKNTIIPVAMFFSLYAIVHISLIDNLNTYSVYKDIVTSLLAGFALSLINICIIARGKSWHFGYECLVLRKNPKRFSTISL